MRHYRHLFIALLAAITAGSTQAQLPAFHGNPQHTGYSTAVGPNLAALKWKLNLGGAILSSPVLGPDGTIYLGSVLNDTKHPELFVTAVNPNGTIKWRFKTGYYDTQVPSSPALGPDGKIYVGAQDGYFYALNPDGTLAWRFQGNGPIQQHPVVAQDGTVYVGIDGRLHAFTSTGVLKWTTNLGDTALPGGPALSADENTIFASGYTSAGPVSTAYAFNRDGSLKWRDDSFYGYYPALCPPTVMPDGRVLFLSGGLFAMDPANGAFYWYYYPSGSYYNSYGSVCADPAGNVVYAFDRFVGKLRTDGTLAWQNEFMGGWYGNEGESTVGSPLVDRNGNVYLGLGKGKRSARDWGKVVRAYSATGQKKWDFALGEGTYTNSPALAADGTLYIGSMDGFLYALGNTSVSLLSFVVSPPSVVGGATATGRVTLSGPPSGDVTVMLLSSNPAASPPASVTVPAGQSSAAFTIQTLITGSQMLVSFKASLGTVTRTASLNVLAGVGLFEFTVSPSIVFGGTPSSGTVSLNTAAPSGGTIVALSSSDPATASVPATVTVPAGSWTAPFTVTTFPTDVDVNATITGTLNGGSKQAPLTVLWTSKVVPPTSLRYAGDLVAGNLASLAAADGNKLNLKVSRASDSLIPISLQLEATSPIATPSRLEFIVRSKCSLAGRRQRIYLWDWAAQAWVFVSSITVPTTDATTTVSLTTNLGRFMQPGTKRMRSKVDVDDLLSDVIDRWEMWFDQAAWRVYR